MSGIPPPAPINPQTKPNNMPQITDWIKRFFALAAVMVSLVVITGLTMNLTPGNAISMRMITAAARACFE